MLPRKLASRLKLLHQPSTYDWYRMFPSHVMGTFGTNLIYSVGRMVKVADRMRWGFVPAWVRFPPRHISKCKIHHNFILPRSLPASSCFASRLVCSTAHVTVCLAYRQSRFSLVAVACRLTCSLLAAAAASSCACPKHATQDAASVCSALCWLYHPSFLLCLSLLVASTFLVLITYPFQQSVETAYASNKSRRRSCECAHAHIWVNKETHIHAHTHKRKPCITHKA